MEILPLLNIQNIDLLSIGVVVSAMMVLGVTVILSNPKSVTNLTFFLLCLFAVLWSVSNYFFYQVDLFTPEISFWILRFVMFFAVWFAFSAFQLLFVFPKETEIFFKGYWSLLFPVTIFVSILTLTPFVFLEILELSETGHILKIQNEFGIVLFGSLVFFLNAGSIALLVRRILTTKERHLKRRFVFILIGISTTLFLIMIFNFFLPAFFDNPRFIPLSSTFIFPFILFTSYAILKHKLFNIKVTGIALLVFALSITAFGEVIFAEELFLIIYRSSIFALILIFGILLIRGVLREISLREQLEEANKAQESLINFITHQIKGFLTKSKYIFAELLEGSFGAVNGEVKKMAEEGLKINTDGVNTVQTILNAANIKTGKITYDIKPINLREIVEQVFEKQKKNAESRGIDLSLTVNPDQSFEFKGDSTQLSEAFSNLIDNSIKYTPEGSIKVSLDKIGNAINFKVKDTGIGIAKEDIGKLFQEGGRATNAQKVNVDSTGFGLYIVKNIIEAHGGRVWVESAGQGKGSEFIVELPVG